MQNNKIVITGGPGTGKSSVIQHLETVGHVCLPEVSREIILDAQKQGISQLFLEKPILFSEKLLEARIGQHALASKYQRTPVFIDRGIPDIVAYMEYLGTSFPPKFNVACREYTYDTIFLLPPWKDIYQTDNERYESYAQALKIHEYLKNAYIKLGYSPMDVPKSTIGSRCDFILSNLDV